MELLPSRIQTAAHVAEVVGAIAIVVSLIYVGSGIRQNTLTVQLSNSYAALTLAHEWDAWMKGVEFAETYILADTDFSSLSPARQMQIDK